jgi:UDP-N-acetylmuramate--alanine ligase
MSAFEGKNIVAVFQPHRYSRLQNLWDEFIESFNGVSRVVVTDVYAASEDKIEGVNAETFTKALNKKQCCEHITGDINTVAQKLLPTLKDNDIVIGLGAGTITNLGKFLQKANEGSSWTLEK